MAVGESPVLRDTLTIDFGACPPGCRACEAACARARTVPRVTAQQLPTHATLNRPSRP